MPTPATNTGPFIDPSSTSADFARSTQRLSTLCTIAHTTCGAGCPERSGGMLIVPTAADVAAAADRIRGYVRTTPIVELTPGTFGVEAALVLKLELLQYTGSFKPRGLFNRALTHQVPAAGLVIASGGNAALAL